MIESLKLSQSAQSILLIDWPDPGLPRTLVSAGLTVFSYSPSGYQSVHLGTASSDKADSVFPPKEDESGYLIFNKCPTPSIPIDIAHIYRPAEELPEIIEELVLPFDFKALWLHPPISSAEARQIATQHKLEYIEGINILDTIQNMRSQQ